MIFEKPIDTHAQACYFIITKSLRTTHLCEMPNGGENMNYLVNLALPNKGDCLTIAEYRNKLARLGYNWYQQIGSLGGARTAGTVAITDAVVVRV